MATAFESINLTTALTGEILPQAQGARLSSVVDYITRLMNVAESQADYLVSPSRAVQSFPQRFPACQLPRDLASNPLPGEERVMEPL